MSRRHFQWKIALLGIVGLLAVVAFGVWVYSQLHLEPLLPVAITKQASFGIYVPTTKASGYQPIADSAKYNSRAGVLSFDAINAQGVIISFSEQATPESFVDIPQVYEKLISNLQAYSSFDSVNGKAALTHPKELNGGQSAVLNGRGTLLFARPTRDLSNDDWRKLLNSLTLLAQ